MTKIVNVFSGPGSGKSTLAAGVFQQLKTRGVNCELVVEFAKLLTWSKRYGELSCQPYVFGKQLKNMQVLLGEVDIIVTDSPILLSCIYSNDWPDSFNRAVVDIFKSFDNLNFFIKRSKPYNPKGRNQTEEESKAIDEQILRLLDSEGIPFDTIWNYESGVNQILEKLNLTINPCQEAFI